MNMTAARSFVKGSILVLFLLLGLVLKIASAQSAEANPALVRLTTLRSFNGADGSQPLSGLVQSTNGDLYGTTQIGGANYRAGGPVGGTIFKITPSGTFTTLYNFCAQTGCADGENVEAGLVQATNGYLYGVTAYGGSNANCAQGCGTLFKITDSGALTTLYSFCSVGCQDGAFPVGGLIQASNGYLYGTTNNNGGGTVFKITPGGTLTTLDTFPSSGGDVFAALVQATNGNLYGTTYIGGNTSCPSGGCGTIFKMTPSGALTTIYDFCSQNGCADGEQPYFGALVEASNGNLYGVTPTGGAYSEGTVFEITPSGTLTTLYNFCAQSGCPDGRQPFGGLVQATDGNLYGTTHGGGTHGNYGTIFTITPSGTLTTLYSFCAVSGCSDGEVPYQSLVQDTNGDLYGTTAAGGTKNRGTIFRLSVGLGPFVKTLPTFGIDARYSRSWGAI